MPYAAQHLLLRAHGSFGSIVSETIEEWSMSWRIFIGATALTEQKKIDFLTSVKPWIDNFFVSTGVHAHPAAWLKRLTAAYIDLDGKYVGGDAQPTTETFYAVPNSGTGSNGHPYSHAMVVSLRSDIDRGPGHAGRFYVPSGENVDNTGRFAPSIVSSTVAAARALIDQINGSARASWSPASAVSVFSKVGTGTIGTVTSVACGRAPDTQRRRDNDVLESYTSLDLTTTLAASEARARRQYVTT